VCARHAARPPAAPIGERAPHHGRRGEHAHAWRTRGSRSRTQQEMIAAGPRSKQGGKEVRGFEPSPAPKRLMREWTDAGQTLVPGWSVGMGWRTAHAPCERSFPQWGSNSR
jgi:hypothetical protein